jgi:DNA replication licensing factor MCM6
MEPYLKKAVQNMVRKYDPQYLKITSGRFAGEEGTVREFWVSWYNLPLNKR